MIRTPLISFSLMLMAVGATSGEMLNCLAIYFTEGNYYPFNKRDIQQYDPRGYALIQKAWWVLDQGSTPALSRSETRSK